MQTYLTCAVFVNVALIAEKKNQSRKMKILDLDRLIRQYASVNFMVGWCRFSAIGGSCYCINKIMLSSAVTFLC